MKRNKTRFVIIILFMLVLFNSLGCVFADPGENLPGDSSTWWGGAYNFWEDAASNNVEEDDTLLSDLKVTVKLLGNAIFIIVAIVLGIKYMLGSIEGKADVKNGMLSLIVAMLMFYGWSAIEDILVSDDYSLIWIKNTESRTIVSVYDTIIFILNYVAVGAIVYIGIKYLLSGAEGKADIKGKGVLFVIGMVMSFSTLTFLNFLRTVLAEIVG